MQFEYSDYKYVLFVVGQLQQLYHVCICIKVSTNIVRKTYPFVASLKSVAITKRPVRLTDIIASKKPSVK